MKKFAKMSLVAAVAVAGLTGTASAADLAEAIKGVDVSGMVRYRYNDQSTTVGGGNGTNDIYNDYDAELTIKSPVNEMVTAVLKLDVAAETEADALSGSEINEGKPSVNLEDVYFSVNTGYATVNAGKQNLPSPMHDGAQGSGLVALIPAGPATIAAAYFNNNSVTGIQEQDVMGGGILASVGPVNLEAWYVDATLVGDFTNLTASATVGPVKVDAGYTKADYDANGKVTAGLDADLVKVSATGSIDALTLKASYAGTGSTTGDATVYQMIDQSAGTEAAANYILWNTNVNGKSDASVIALDASFALTDKVALRAAYADGDYKNTSSVKVDTTEILGQVTYTMSSNLVTYLRYAEYEAKTSGSTTSELTRGRLEIKYSF